MAKIKGFLSQDVQVTRKETPDSPFTTKDIPPSWLPLMEKIMKWYDNQIYPVWTPRGYKKTRSRLQKDRDKTWITEIKNAWAGVAAGTKANWKTAADFVRRNGYQLFVKDYAYRKRNHLSLPGTPNVLHQTHGLKMSNPGPVAQCRLQRDDIILTGQITLSFNYKKVEHAPTGGDPFNFAVTLYYFEDGLIKTETHTWNAPAGNVAWAAVSETYGTADRFYFHHRIIFYLDNYDADVYFANFLLQDKTRTWTVDYDGTVLPDAATPAWTKTGDVSSIAAKYGSLRLKEVIGSNDFIEYSRVPTFINSIGSSVKFRLKIVSGPAKEVPITDIGWSDKKIDWADLLQYWSGIENAIWADPNIAWANTEGRWSAGGPFVARIVHSDGVRRVEYLFNSNGFILRLGEEEFRYHLDMSRYRTFRSFIQGDRLYFYHGRTLLFRKELTTSGDQEVTFGHYGRAGFNTESRWGFVKYFHGEAEDPGFDVIREGWWLNVGDKWEPDTLYRKQGWTFLPEYHVPYFDVVYLT